MSQKSKMSLDKLKEQREKLNARILQQESRLKQNQRKIDTRKKILVGSYFLDQHKSDEKLNELTKLMESYLKRNSDRVLFNLEPLSDQVSADN
ncbi:MAG: mobilization protein [Coxiellaceae bacterium]|nr:mobilization protein [Coxiellaceae bacterium]